MQTSLRSCYSQNSRRHQTCMKRILRTSKNLNNNECYNGSKTFLDIKLMLIGVSIILCIINTLGTFYLQNKFCSWQLKILEVNILYWDQKFNFISYELPIQMNFYSKILQRLHFYNSYDSDWLPRKVCFTQIRYHQQINIYSSANSPDFRTFHYPYR